MGLKASAPGIPTDYSGYRFRSRGEAGWAAFFHLLGWRWRYEPVDLAGYIPDFVVPLDFPLLVEVKPAYSLDQIREHGTAEMKKIEKTGWRSRALLVGAHLLDADDGAPDCLGMMGIPLRGPELALPDHQNPVPMVWRPARLMWCTVCNGPTIRVEGPVLPRCVRRTCRAAEPPRPLDPRHVHSLWALAWNMVRWVGKAPTTVRVNRGTTRTLFA